MTEVLIVKTAAAAANPALTSVSFPFSGASVSIDKAGNAIIGGGAGALVSPPAAWWDSSLKDASADGPGGDLGPQLLARTVSSAGETVNVAALAAKPGLNYPLFIDPNVTTESQNAWGFVQSTPTGGDANSSFWQGTIEPNIDPYYVAHTGYIPASANNVDHVGILARALWSFPVPSTMWGTHIVTGAFNGVITHSSACSGATTTDAYYVSGPVTATTTWNNQPTPGQVLDSVPITNSSASCNYSNNSIPVGFNVAGAFATAAATNLASVGLGLRADDDTGNPAATYVNSWRKFGNMSVQVTYGVPPATPTGVGIRITGGRLRADDGDGNDGEQRVLAVGADLDIGWR